MCRNSQGKGYDLNFEVLLKGFPQEIKPLQANFQHEQKQFVATIARLK
jgi:hypothetical protein